MRRGMMNRTEALEFMASLSEKRRLTLKLIAEYLSEVGRRCFTYRGLRAYWDVRRLWNELEWHTVERNIRWLAENGLLRRIQRGRSVIFCLEDETASMLATLGWLKLDAQTHYN